MNDVTPNAGLSRRGFVSTTAAIGGGLMVGVGVPAIGRAAITSKTVTAWVSIASDETVTILVGSQDMGQGVLSSLAQIVAEELRIDWTHVKSQHAPPNAIYDNPIYGSQLTAGSGSVRGYFQGLLQAGATAREMLIAAGAAVLKVAATDCVGQNGFVVSKSLGTSISYGKVAAAAAKLTPPANPPLYSANGYTLVGQSVKRPDIPSKVNGSAIFGIDVRVPGMRYGAVKLCPVNGGTVKTMGAAPAGVTYINVGTGIVAVLDARPGANTFSAFTAANAAKVTWNLPAGSASQNSTTILAQGRALLTSGSAIVAETAGNVAKAQGSAAKVVDATYTLPYLAHATMEPLNCTASVTSTGCEIWAPTQAPGTCQLTASAITGFAPASIIVHPVLLGGGLGRKFEQDYIAYAVAASKAVGAPVKVTWQREQDFAHDQYRPLGVCRVTGGLDASGNLISWAYRNVSPGILFQRGWVPDGVLDSQASEGATDITYSIPNRQVDWVRHPAAIPVGFWRSVGNSINAFAKESAIDELALAAGIDPLVFRQKLLAGNARSLNVLNTAAALGNWNAALPAGHARGIAYHESFGSLVAVVVELMLSGKGVKIINVAAAVDCGLVVNPDTGAQQVEGAIVHGMSAALWGKMSFAQGVSQVVNFDQYPMTRMGNMPTVQVSLIQTPGAALGGLGEVGVPCVAPAIANAYARLTGTRLRDLPLFPGTGITGGG